MLKRLPTTSGRLCVETRPHLRPKTREGPSRLRAASFAVAAVSAASAFVLFATRFEYMFLAGSIGRSHFPCRLASTICQGFTPWRNSKRRVQSHALPAWLCPASVLQHESHWQNHLASLGRAIARARLDSGFACRRKRSEVKPFAARALHDTRFLHNAVDVIAQPHAYNTFFPQLLRHVWVRYMERLCQFGWGQHGRCSASRHHAGCARRRQPRGKPQRTCFLLARPYLAHESRSPVIRLNTGLPG